MENRIDSFSTFLKNVEESTRSQHQGQYRSGSSNAVACVLEVVLGFPDGIDARQLLEQSGVSVIDFGQAVDRLIKLGGMVVETSSGREVMKPGPQAGEVLSLVR